MAFTLRLSPAHEQALTLLASSQGISKHEAALRAIVAAAARIVDDEIMTELARTTIDSYCDLERRIARTTQRR